MCLLYRLPNRDTQAVKTLLSWARDDPPSQRERAYSSWVRKRRGIGNPFIEHPSLAQDPELSQHLMGQAGR